MGWLPGRPAPCRCGHPHASRKHLLSCLSVASRLDVAILTPPNPLDYVLNELPSKPAKPNTTETRVVSRWSTWWPEVCKILLEIDQICHPDETFTGDALDTSGSTFLNWYYSNGNSSLLLTKVPEVIV
ncbi:Putative Polyprotein [Rhizopus microsporus]|nr:Putative Polyprotein [Rhizopus microsporus]